MAKPPQAHEATLDGSPIRAAGLTPASGFAEQPA
jgi:hypothetical protein